jgi:hypothetical protein
MSPQDTIMMAGAVLAVLAAIAAAVVGHRRNVMAVEAHESAHDDNRLTSDSDGGIGGSRVDGDDALDVEGAGSDRDYLDDSVATLRRLSGLERDRAARQFAAANALTMTMRPVSPVHPYTRDMPVSRPPLRGGWHRLPDGWPS